MTDKSKKLVCTIHYDGDLVPATLRCGKGSMFRSPEYKAFRETVSWLFKAQYPDCHDDILYKIEIDMRQNVQGNKRRFYRGDIDNMTKPIMDSATGIIWKDDGQVTELHVKLNKESDSSGFDARIYDMGIWHNYRVDCTCLNCGKQFKVLLSQSQRGVGKFCSMDCQRKYQRITRVCLQCGKEFTVRRNALKYRVANFCSNACKGKYMSSHINEFPNMLENLEKGKR